MFDTNFPLVSSLIVLTKLRLAYSDYSLIRVLLVTKDTILFEYTIGVYIVQYEYIKFVSEIKRFNNTRTDLVQERYLIICYNLFKK